MLLFFWGCLPKEDAVSISEDLKDKEMVKLKIGDTAPGFERLNQELQTVFIHFEGVV